MHARLKNLLMLGLGLLSLAGTASAQDIAQQLYSRYESSVYRVEVVTPGLKTRLLSVPVL